MSKHTIACNAFAFANYDNQGANDHTSGTVDLGNYKSRLFCKIPTTENVSWGFKRIKKITAKLYVSSIDQYSAADGRGIESGYAKADFNPLKLTYSNMPSVWDVDRTVRFNRIGYVETPVSADNPSTRQPIDYGIYFSLGVGDQCFVDTPTGLHPPQVVFDVDETEFVRVKPLLWETYWGGKTVTYSAGSDLVIGALPTPDGLSYTPVEQTGISGLWRESANSEVHEIPMADGNSKKVIFPVGTFAGLSKVEINVKITTNGVVTYTPDLWCTVNLTDAVATAVPLSPVGEPVTTDTPILFSWAHVISSGSAQTKADLQRSTDGKTWSALATVTGAATTYTAPANTFASGTNFWRVRTYNADGIAGEWSAQAEFICIGAPDAPVVTIAADSPRPAVAWQVDGQLAYQVELAGQPVSSVYYGTEKTWTSPTYLPDGVYTVRVRVQNEYGLWSPWGEAALEVVNVPGAAISLTVEAEDAARLAWQTTGSYDFFLIYRDGRLIGRTTERSFTDAASVGAVRYQVRGCYSGSANYGLSPEVAATIAVQYITLSDMDTGAILPLPYSESAHRTTSRTRKQEVQAVQLAGRAYPVIERSEHMAQSISVACAFYTQEDCAALEAMLGHLVTVRTPEGRMVTGCLAQLTERTDGGFYSVYTFSVDQADWEEAIRIDA